MTLSIPQSSPGANYLARKAEISAAVSAVMEGGWYILGKEVAAFEREFAAYVGVAEAVGVASGTDAVHLALRAAGVGAGDLVFTVAHTAVATVAAVEQCGATPVFVDIDPAAFVMDCDALARVIAKTAGAGRPRAVIPVHLYGHPADMPAVLDIAKRHDLIVVEDCAQSHGARLAERMTGSWGQVAAFSFYPTKNLSALGDGGAVVSNDGEIAKHFRLLREYGWEQRYVSKIAGFNSRLDELQAAILRVKLRYLDQDNAARRRLAARYDVLLAESGLTLPLVRPGAHHVYHQYVVRSPQRDALQAYLRSRGVGTLIHYPVPVHRQPAYAGRLGCDALANTEAAAREVLSLPMYPELPLADAEAAAREVVAGVRPQAV